MAQARTRLVVGLGGGLLHALMRSTRVEIRNRESYQRWWGERKPVIFLLWHGRLLPCSYAHRDEELGTLISQHRDGDYIAGVVEGWWGYHAIRGSSTRGGTGALREMVRTLKAGTALAVTPDGPRGPRQKMKSGPLLAAQLTGVPLIPVSASADRAWFVGGWDRFLIPKPFSRVRVIFGEPTFVPRDATPDDIDRIGEQMEHELNQLMDEADRSWSEPR